MTIWTVVAAVTLVWGCVLVFALVLCQAAARGDEAAARDDDEEREAA